MKLINNFQEKDSWFFDKENSTGPLTMAFKSGSKVVAGRHYHRSTHEYYLVLEGEATLIINERPIRLKRGSAVIVEPLEIHSLSDATEDSKIILIMEKFVPNDKVDVGD